jgi:polyphosphate glucokinase
MIAAKKSGLKNRKSSNGLKTLSIDVGGSRLKATVLDETGKMIVDRVRTDTPKPCPPDVLLRALKRLVSGLPAFDRVAVGFPGVVRKGKILVAVNLGSEFWRGFDLDSALTKQFGKPTRVINDADMQGLAAIKGKGVELVITLGTGVGSGLFEDGRLAPHLEIGHIPFRNGETFEEQLGNPAFEEIGKRRWNRRLDRAIKYWRILTNFDKLYLGGGNAEFVSLKLDPDVEIVSNELGLIGGIWLWKERTR